MAKTCTDPNCEGESQCGLKSYAHICKPSVTTQTHEDEFGIRIVQTCHCGKYRVLDIGAHTRPTTLESVVTTVAVGPWTGNTDEY